MKFIASNSVNIDEWSVVLDNDLLITYVPAGTDPAHFIGTEVEETLTFPLENVLDLHPQKVMRTTALSDTGGEVGAMISIPFPYGYTDSIALFNTNASIAIVSVINTDSTHTEYTDGEEVYTESIDLQGAATYQQWISDRGKKEQTEFFITYPHLTTSHIVNIYLLAPVDGTGKIEAGVVFVGEVQQVSTLINGITQTFKDYSVVSELANGSTYILNRSIVRLYNFALDMCDSGGDPHALQRAFEEVGAEPIPWLIDDSSQERWLVFARKNTEPSGNFYAFNRVKANISLIEVL